MSESKEKGLVSSPVVVEEIGDDTERASPIRLAVEGADVEEGVPYAMSQAEREEELGEMTSLRKAAMLTTNMIFIVVNVVACILSIGFDMGKEKYNEE